MDFYLAIQRLQPQLTLLVRLLNDQMVSPELRKRALTAAFTQIGQSVYGKAYHMTAYDMLIAETIGKGFDVQLAIGLARNVSDSIAMGDGGNAGDQVKTYALSASGSALSDAFETAGQLGKYRTLQYRLRGKGDCDWCRNRARAGKIINPTAADFRRHNRCDCFFDVQGYKSRNGELRNYRPAVRS